MAKNDKEFTFKIKQNLEVLSENGNRSKEVNLVSWNGGKTKLDIREWYTDDEGNKKPGKGISLDSEQTQLLANVLEDFHCNFDAYFDI